MRSRVFFPTLIKPFAYNWQLLGFLSVGLNSVFPLGSRHARATARNNDVLLAVSVDNGHLETPPATKASLSDFAIIAKKPTKKTILFM